MSLGGMSDLTYSKYIEKLQENGVLVPSKEIFALLRGWCTFLASICLSLLMAYQGVVSNSNIAGGFVGKLLQLGNIVIFLIFLVIGVTVIDYSAENERAFSRVRKVSKCWVIGLVVLLGVFLCMRLFNFI